jgi:hypothetical protein
MKRTCRCPKCGGDVIVRLESVGDASDWVGSGTGALGARSGTHLAPRRILLAQATSTGLFGGTTERHRETGETEAFVCAGCGYLEEHVKNVHEIDWQTVVGATRWMAPK